MNYIMMALFAYSAIVQLNDPDPIPWVLLYLAALAFCGLWVAGRMPVVTAFVFSAGSLIAGLVFLVQAVERDVWLWDENVNEAAGPLIVFLWISSLAWLQWREKAFS